MCCFFVFAFFLAIFTNEDISIVLGYPLTGRKHQIRRHLKENNTPVVGDTYRKAEYICLHALFYEFNMPPIISGKYIAYNGESIKRLYV